MALVAGGDERAFEALHSRHAASAHAVALNVVGDALLAEDAVQDAFLTAWRSAAGFTPAAGTVSAWLLTIVHRRAVDVVRRRSREIVWTGPEQSDPASEAALTAVVDHDSLRRALLSLPAQFRAPLALAYYGGMTQAECAELLRDPVGTVKSRTARGMWRLRAHLGEPVGPPPAK